MLIFVPDQLISIRSHDEETRVSKQIMSFAILSAAALAPAWAQTSTAEIYGIIDVGVAYSNHRPGGSSKEVHSGGLSGNRLGFRGTEDLGGGLRAQFALEHGLNTDTGAQADAGKFWNRMAYAGLGGPWGNLTLGRQYTAGFSMLVGFMPMAFAVTYEPYGSVISARADNSIVYDGTFAPVRVRAHYSMGEVAGSSSAGSTYGLAASYTQGAVSVAGVYDHVNGALTAKGHSRQNIAGLAARYRASEFGVMGGWRSLRSESDVGATTRDDRLWWVGTSYRILPQLDVTVAYYRNDIKRSGALVNPPSPGQFSLWGVYSLSKRTALYAAAAQARNAPLDFGIGGFTLGAGQTTQTGLATGVRHTF